MGGATFTLADVMGKGVGAAIIAATVRAVLRADSKHLQISDALRETAEILKEDLEVAGTFVTLFHARLNTETGALSYIDAGRGLTISERTGHKGLYYRHRESHNCARRCDRTCRASIQVRKTTLFSLK